MSFQNLNLFAPGFKHLREIPDEEDRFLWAEWSPNGQALALASSDGGGFCLWREESPKLEYRWCGAFAGVEIVAWSPDSYMIAAGCVDGTIQLQPLKQREVLLQVDTGFPYRSVKDLKWSSDGLFFVAGYSGGIVRLWSVKTGKSLKQFSCGSRPEYYFNIALSPDSKLLAASDTRAVRIWNINSNELIRKLEGHSATISCLDWSANGQYLAVGSLDARVYVWDAKTGKLVKELSEAKEKIRYVRFSPDTQLLAATSDDNIIRLWSCHDWQQRVQLPELSGGITGGLAFHPQKPILATGGQDGHMIRLWQYDLHTLQR